MRISRRLAAVIVASVVLAGALTCTILALVLFRYRPAVAAAPGYEMRWLTRPAFWEGVVKSYDTFLERRGACGYVLVGWSAEGTLFFQETCRDGASQAWAYEPAGGNPPRPVQSAPPNLLPRTVPRTSILDWVRCPSVRPADTEPAQRSLSVPAAGAGSPDGRWVAVVARQIYGPEDVIVLGRQGAGEPLVTPPPEPAYYEVSGSTPLRSPTGTPPPTSVSTSVPVSILAPATPSPTSATQLVPVSTVAFATPLPTPVRAESGAMANAQQALAAYQPAADAQPVVSTLLSGIAAWLCAGGDLSLLQTILNEMQVKDLHGPVRVFALDLTGDGRADVVVRIPLMGLPLLAFVREGSGPVTFAGYALPPDLESIRTDSPLEDLSDTGKQAVQLEDLTGDGVPEVLFTTLFCGADNYRFRPHGYQWRAGGFRLIFAADVVSWAEAADYVLEPDPTGQGRSQFVLTYPYLYSQGFDHKMVNHPAGRQVWRWNEEAGRFTLAEEQVDLGHSAGGAAVPVTAEDRMRWHTDEGEEAFRAGAYEDAIAQYEEVLRRAEAEGWQPNGQDPYWPIYAGFRRAEALLLLGRSQSGLPVMRVVAAEWEGDPLGELAQAFLQGYGDGSSPDAAARGVAAMQGVDLYTHFYYERGGLLRFPMDAAGILYPGAGLAAYLNVHPEFSTDFAALRAGLRAAGFRAEEIWAVDGGGLRITLSPPEAPPAVGGGAVAWLLSKVGGAWLVSLPAGSGEWPTVGTFAP